MNLFTTDNKIKVYERLLAHAVVDFMRSKYGFKSKIIIHKTNDFNLIGSIPLGHNSIVKDIFYLALNTNAGFKWQIIAMLHELTHVKQVANKELRVSDDYRSILWKDNEPLSLKEYKKIVREVPKNLKNFNVYKQLPWEIEAYDSENLYEEFINSPQYLDLKGKDVNLDFIMDGLTERYIKHMKYISLFENFNT